MSSIRNLKEILTEKSFNLLNGWHLQSIQSDECISYVAWNSEHREALIIDPKKEDFSAYESIFKELKGYLWLGVFDSHTHADHISCAADVSQIFGAPLFMHQNAPSRRVDLRISRSLNFPSRSGALHFIPTPGHTPDSITVIWGPFLFGGDTFLYGDVGRDDLPGGDAEAHYESIQKIKSVAKPEMIMLPGHDHKGGRASTWETQLQVNGSLTQPRAEFVKEATEFNGQPPKLLKESLRENFK